MIPIHIQNQKDVPIGDAPLVFGAEIRTALMRCTGLDYDNITKRHVAELTQQQIGDLEISDQLRRKLTSLRDYTSSLLHDCDLLAYIRREFTCPIAAEIRHGGTSHHILVRLDKVPFSLFLLSKEQMIFKILQLLLVASAYADPHLLPGAKTPSVKPHVQTAGWWPFNRPVNSPVNPNTDINGLSPP